MGVPSRTCWVRLILLLVCAAPFGVACEVTKATPPPLTGPSELATSLTLLANPDVLSQDGRSQSQLVVEARNANSQPIADLPVRAEIFVGGVPVDFGSLSHRTAVTGRDGRALFTYTAPPPPPDPVDEGLFVTIGVTPSGNDFRAAVARQVDIRLVPPGVILPPNGAPTARFINSEPTEVGTAIRFDATSSTDDGLILSYRWDFGDGTSGTGAIVNHTYQRAGSFGVTLTVTDDRGLSASTTRTIAVGSTPAPTANFTFSPASPGIGDRVFFDASSSAAGEGRRIVSYDWSFGDGGTASGVTASRSYGAVGSYNVTLTVTDDQGKTGTISRTVVVGAQPRPTAAFVFSPTSPAVNQEVHFDGTLSTPPPGRTIARWDWSFGDGTSGSGRTADHAYRQAGVYAVVLTVTDSAGQIASTSQTLTVGQGAQPTASFTVSPNPAAVGQTVQFNAAASSGGSGQTITSYQWNFGDGTSPNNTATGQTATHVYNSPGTYAVVLTVTNSAGQTASTTQNVTVGQASQPTASFTASPNPAAVGQTVQFNGAASSGGSGATITSYQWNFGDGASPNNTATGQTATHVYNSPGTYVVVLTVTNSAGQTASTSQNVTVNQASQPSAAFTFSPNPATVGQTVQFNGSGSSGGTGATITSYQWNFGDAASPNNTATGQTATHVYNTAGIYTVVLTVTNSAGQTASTSQNVTVNSQGQPTASFTISPNPANVGQTVQVDAAASTAPPGATITSYQWNFGDAASASNTATGQTASHVYNTAGTYTITLTVTDSNGNQRTTTGTVAIN